MINDNEKEAEDRTEEKLRHLFAYTEEEQQFSDAEVDTLIEVIDGAKILDPACGSGAFPIGILHKLVFILGKIDPHNKRWKQKQLDKLDSVSMREELERTFRDNDDDYGRKLCLIENCIYGVDIQPIAIQISKLRFFISLICNQRTNKNKAQNCGVRPLPNLETKFVSANTLISLDQGEGLLVDPRLPKLEKELAAVRHRHFAAQRRRNKLALQKKDAELREEIANVLASGGMSGEASHQLAAWDPYDQNTSAPFFDPEWMFGVRYGFAVVLGNPPYVFGGNKGISRGEKNIYKRLYVSGSNKINLFTLFIECGSALLRSQGILSYILPNTLLRVTSYSNTRRFIVDNLCIREIVDLDIGVFDGVTASTVVISLANTIPGPNASVGVKRGCEDAKPLQIPQADWRGRGCVFDIFSTSGDKRLMQKLAVGSTPLGELCSRIRFGVVISGNFVDVVSTKKLNSKWKPFLEGGEIGPFFIRYSGRFLFYDKDHLHRSRTPDIFETKKIMIQRITGGNSPLKATLDVEHFYNKESILNLILNSDNVSYEYILGLLNSRLANWLYKRRFTNSSKLTVNLSKEYVGQIPVRIVEQRRQQLVAKIVGEILEAKRRDVDSDTSGQERRLDTTIYEIYGLTEDEIAIVEGDST